MEGDDLVNVATDFIKDNKLDPNLSHNVYDMLKRANKLHQEKMYERRSLSRDHQQSLVTQAAHTNHVEFGN